MNSAPEHVSEQISRDSSRSDGGFSRVDVDVVEHVVVEVRYAQSKQRQLNYNLRRHIETPFQVVEETQRKSDL